MNADFSKILDMLPFLIPLFLIELVLLVIALIDVIRREKVTGNNKVVWILVIVLFQVIGPVVYFIFGRKESNIDGD
ncbi:MAG: PLD nuclease N-terminal domain-containing protein [Dehalococcoidales bacterium]|nr:PLD nuclease N-terminal domain-containing protein [Dehalococcoidales bacterium]